MAYAIFYDYHEQGGPRAIAGVYGHNQEMVEKEFNQLTGLDTLTTQAAIDWHEHAVVRIDCSELYHRYALGLEIDYDHERALDKFAPELRVAIKANQYVDPFAWKFQGEAAENFVWRKRFHIQIEKHVSNLIKVLPKRKPRQ